MGAGRTLLRAGPGARTFRTPRGPTQGPSARWARRPPRAYAATHTSAATPRSADYAPSEPRPGRAPVAVTTNASTKDPTRTTPASRSGRAQGHPTHTCPRALAPPQGPRARTPASPHRGPHTNAPPAPAHAEATQIKPPCTPNTHNPGPPPARAHAGPGHTWPPVITLGVRPECVRWYLPTHTQTHRCSPHTPPHTSHVHLPHPPRAARSLRPARPARAKVVVPVARPGPFGRQKGGQRGGGPDPRGPVGGAWDLGALTRPSDTPREKGT